MLQWNEKVGDIALRDLNTLCSGRPWSQALDMVLSTLRDPQIRISEQCHGKIGAHVESDCHRELGGLLLGEVYSTSLPVRHGYPYLTLITETVPSLECRNSSVSLSMGTELWDRAHPFIERGLMVIGWYHSHPDLGAFFSATDCATQKAFFCNPYSVGLVLDPVRDEMKCYTGAHAMPLARCVQVIDDRDIDALRGISPETSMENGR